MEWHEWEPVAEGIPLGQAATKSMSSDAQQKPYPGLVLSGKYRIEVLLGAGGMGEVYGATQLNLGRKVALKVLHPQYAVQEGALQRFEREARVAAALDHPNAVKIYDFGKSQGYVYLAMEMLSGVPLRNLVDEDLPLLAQDRVVRILGDIADVLVKAHAIGLVHRDLKPDNVFLEPATTSGTPERVVVVDFGLAFIDGAGDVGRLTRDGQITGTPDYLSPEQGLAKSVGPPTDIYALGCMLYEMLVGRVPFHGHYLQIITQQIYSRPESLRTANPDVKVPHALEELVMKMLEKDPSIRPTAPELVRALLTLGGRSERGRAAHGVDGRAARMISSIRPPVKTEELQGIQLEEKQIAVLGALDRDHVIGLSTHGLVAYVAELHPELGAPYRTVTRDIEGAAAIWAPDIEPEELARLKAEWNKPVLTDVTPGDSLRLTNLLRAGAAEVLTRPVSPDDLARKLLRAIKKHRR